MIARPEQTSGSSHSRFRALPRRRGPVGLSLAVALVGMAYSLLWGPVVRHQNGWVTPGDIWATYRGAHFVAWGALGDVYSAHTGLVSFPGLLILLAPLSMITSAFGLTEAFPMGIAHPTAWLVLGPVSLLTVAVPLCGLDALAEMRGVGGRGRTVRTVLEAAALWAMVAIWGHPEDGLAFGLAVYALVSAYRGHWTATGWLLGCAVAVQPLSVLVVPVIWGFAPKGRKVGLLARTALPASVLVSLLLGADFHDTWQALTRQPNYPTVDHPTPWVWLSPSLGGKAVAAGPGRALALVCAVGIGFWVWQSMQRGRNVDLVWMAALAFGARCLFEPVMVPYYVAPVVALAAVLARRDRLIPVALAGMGLTIMVNTHAGPVRWWLEMVVLLAGTLIASWFVLPDSKDRRLVRDRWRLSGPEVLAPGS